MTQAKRILIVGGVAGGANIDDLADLELCYAPPFGSAKDPVNMAGMVGKNIRGGLVEVAQWSEIANLPPSTTILDVRDPSEFGRGAIPGAIHIPLNELRARLAELPIDRELLVYCASGQRSYSACRILSQHGYKCRNLSGAHKTWSAAVGRGRSMETGR